MKTKLIFGITIILIATCIAFKFNIPSSRESSNYVYVKTCVLCPCAPNCQPGDPQCVFKQTVKVKNQKLRK